MHVQGLIMSISCCKFPVRFDARNVFLKFEMERFERLNRQIAQTIPKLSLTQTLFWLSRVRVRVAELL